MCRQVWVRAKFAGMRARFGGRGGVGEGFVGGGEEIGLVGVGFFLDERCLGRACEDWLEHKQIMKMTVQWRWWCVGRRCERVSWEFVVKRWR